MLSEKYLTQHVKKSREFFAFAHCHYICRCTLYNITRMLLHSELYYYITILRINIHILWIQPHPFSVGGCQRFESIGIESRSQCSFQRKQVYL